MISTLKALNVGTDPGETDYFFFSNHLSSDIVFL